MKIKPFENKIWLASPYMHREEQEFIRDAFEKNWITTAGENIDRLAEEMCSSTGAAYGVPLSSGTAALHLALVDAGIGPEDVVLCSDLTFAASANPITYLGATPVFVGSEEETWNMDPAALLQAFNLYPKAKAVVCVNLYGVPARLDEIKEICQVRGAVLIEDAAESLGTAYRGRQSGTWGDYGILSFNGNKIITGSTGGMLLTGSRERAEHVRKLSTQAREQVSWYEHEETGYNYRMSNIIAGIVRGQLIHLDEHIAGKRAIYERYCDGFKALPVTMHGGGNYWLSCLKIEDEAVKPEDIIGKLAEYNVEARHIWKPMSLQPIFAGRDCCGSSFSRQIFERGLCLPSDLNMTEEDQAAVIEIVKSCF